MKTPFQDCWLVVGIQTSETTHPNRTFSREAVCFFFFLSEVDRTGGLFLWEVDLASVWFRAI